MFEVIIYSFASGVIGTGLGGLLGVFLAKWSKKLFVPMMSLSGGIMIAIALFELLPDAIELGGIFLTVCACLLGMLFVVAISFFTKPKKGIKTQRKSGYFKTGIMICLAIGIHNLPEGLVIGSSEVISGGLILAIIISLHNIPEGISMTMPLVLGGMSKPKSVFLSLLSGLPTVLGGVIGYLLGGISSSLIATCYGIAGGTMLFISFDDVFSSAYSEVENKAALPFFALAGLLLGVVICSI